MVKCFIPGCGSSRAKNRDLSFCRIPLDKTLKNKWQNSILKGTGYLCEAAFNNENSRICSKHFKNEDLSFNNYYMQRKSDSIPSIFIYSHTGFGRDTYLKCRICLKNSGLEELSLDNMLPNSTITISTAILKSFDINLRDDPDFPETICARCFNLVAASYVLKLEILKSKASLHKLLELRKEKKFYKIFDGNEFEIANVRKPKTKYTLKEAQPASKIPIMIVSSTSISTASHNNSNKVLNFEFVSGSDIKTEIKNEPLEMPIVGEQKIFAEVLSDDEIIKEFKQEEEEIIHDAPTVDEEERLEDCVALPDHDQWLVLEEVDLDEELGTNYDGQLVQDEVQILEIEDDKEEKEEDNADKMIDLILANTLNKTRKRRKGNVTKSYKAKKPVASEVIKSAYEEWKKRPSQASKESVEIDFETYLKNIPAAKLQPQENVVKKVYEEWPKPPKPVVDRFPHRRCKKCNFVGNHLNELLLHVDENESCSELYNPTKECYICHRKFMKLINKVKHVKRDHADFKITECTFCFRAGLNSPISYERHVRRHFAPPDVVCNQCGKGYYKAEHLQLHLHVHDKNFWRQCDHCDFKTKSRNTIANHIQRHFKDSNKRYMCSQCPKSFAISALLRKHSFLLHKQSEEGCYYCENCNFCFLFKPEYKQHIDKCNGPTGKKWPIHSTRIRRIDLHKNSQIIELPKNC